MSLPSAMRGIRTEFGIVPVCCRPPSGRPLVLAIRGAFAGLDQLCELTDLLPEADVAFAHLPGLLWRSESVSVPAFALAMREMIEREFGDRHLTILGGSVGGVVALHLTDQADVIALDPPLTTEGLWPLETWANSADLSQMNRQWYDAVLGGQSYLPVLNTLARPVTVLAASEPLNPPRPFNAMPGLLSDEAVAALRAHPLVNLKMVEGTGHDILKDRPDAVVRALRQAILEPGTR